ncbi:MAG: surface protein, partial [Flavipsychrobacter sp.]|nr:surface protein [Flavipsychrobacter sp.]
MKKIILFLLMITTVCSAFATISGGNTLCAGTTIHLTNNTPNGVWSSENTTIATVNATGTVKGMHAGTATISYNTTTTHEAIIVVVSAPDPISGDAEVCMGKTTRLTDATGDGTWSSSNTAVTIDNSGTATGVSAGTAIITFTDANSCTTTTVVTVKTNPDAITGNAVYVGKTATLTSSGMGTWSCSNTNASIIPASGIITGASLGRVIITYTDGGCAATKVVTVIPLSSKPGFSLTGTIYGGLPYITDDNPAGFTQTYIRANINRHHDSFAKQNLVFFHNFYMEGYISSNVGSLHTYDTTITNPVSYVNRLDLYQFANVKLNLHQNLFYVRNNPSEIEPKWKTVAYLDLMESFLRTNVTDSISKKASNVSSWVLGANFTVKVFNNKNLADLPWALRLSGELFWINPLTNLVNPDLSFQYADKDNAPTGTNPINAHKSMVVNP